MNEQRKATLLGTSTDGPFWGETLVKDGRLSIAGVAGPKRNGDATGSCGQCREYLDDLTNTRPGLDIAELARIWDRWHLNDMRAGSPAQEAWLRDNGRRGHDYSDTCARLAEAGLNPDPTTGYRYGSAWLSEPLPDDVVAFIDALPDNTDSFPWRR